MKQVGVMNPGTHQKKNIQQYYPFQEIIHLPAAGTEIKYKLLKVRHITYLLVSKYDKMRKRNRPAER